jgi:hypothetical protein
MLQWSKAMKLSIGRLLFLLAWLLAAVVQLVVITRAPDTLVISGVDIARENAAVLQHQLIVVGFGIALAVGAFMSRKWGLHLVIATSVIYIVHWFPFQSVYKAGPIAVAKAMLLLGSNPGLRLPFVTRDVVLPIVFCASIVFAVLELHRHRLTVRS